MTTRISEETRARIRQAWPTILRAVADGELIRDTLKANCITLDMMRAYRAGVPEAQAEWEQAKADSADAFFDDLRAMANKSHVDPGSARVNADILKWLAAKRNPRQYSDKAMLEVNVRTVDLTRIIEAANARIAGQRAPLVLENQAPGLLELAAPAMRALADLL